MSINLSNLEIVYKKLYEVSSQIAQLIERELYNDLIGYIDKKDQLLSESSQILKKITESGENADHLQELCLKIQEQELANIKSLSVVRDKIKEELQANSTNRKFVNAYSSSTPSNGSILDCSE